MTNIIYAEELDKPWYEEAVDHIFKLTKTFGNIRNIGVDASNPNLIVSSKKELSENSNWSFIHEKIQYCKKKNLDIGLQMIVYPIVFNTENILSTYLFL